jgi:hypothetical protein
VSRGAAEACYGCGAEVDALELLHGMLMKSCYDVLVTAALLNYQKKLIIYGHTLAPTNDLLMTLMYYPSSGRNCCHYKP